MIEVAQVLVSVPAIIAATEWLKAVDPKITGRKAQLFAVIFGMLFSLVKMFTLYYIDTFTIQLLMRELVEGFLYGLAAAGFYDISPLKKNTTHYPSSE